MNTSRETNYDPIAEVYLKSTDEKPFTAYYERPFIIASLPDLKGKNVLDLGCATGYYSKYCLDRGANVMSVDVSRKMVDHTKNVCDNKVKAHIHDIAKPFTFIEDNEIDVIIGSLVMQYVEDWNAPLDEFFRILKVGGMCILSTHHPINDFTHFNQDDYFSKRLIEDEWKGFEKPIKVKYFVRPLSEYIQPILDCKLKLKRIVEPKPADSLKERDERMFARLEKRPCFLFFILNKEM
ncbi:class I SAM-dependent methyltransferase [Candidatus Sumerlaeota bacterium]|nr:class I SAM-dependent methyltransferase [Candidatus Sumerlaeota bacterium]